MLPVGSLRDPRWFQTATVTEFRTPRSQFVFVMAKVVDLIGGPGRFSRQHFRRALVVTRDVPALIRPFGFGHYRIPNAAFGGAV
jgi:hypothetical protein